MAGFTGFLTEGSIRRLVEDEKTLITGNFDPSCLSQWRYDLRLGDEAFLSSDKELRRLKDGDTITIRTGEFALLMTHETVKIPKTLVGFISLKLSFALKGLVNISGFHIDPDFEGRLVFSVYNAGPNPVVMRYKEAVFMVIFAPLDGDGGKKDGVFNRLKQLKSEWISSVKGPPISLIALDRKVERLSGTVNLLIALIIALVGTVVATFLIGGRP